jgi:hypothetical protein
MARVALRSLFTAVVFGLLWIFTWPIYFDKEIRHGVSSEAGKIQIYTDTPSRKFSSASTIERNICRPTNMSSQPFTRKRPAGCATRN